MSKQGFVIAFVGIIIGLLILGASPFYIVDVTQNAIVAPSCSSTGSWV